MFVIAGLGNPGSAYHHNRHNVGFMAIDSIAEAHHFPPFKAKFNAFISEKTFADSKVILCKPLTYMNRSGSALSALMSFFKVPLEGLWVIHDDLDLDFGRVKLKQGGGSGGHNGLKSLDQTLGLDYWRLRLGIGHPGHASAVSSYVLSDFNAQERGYIPFLLDAIADSALNLFAQEGGVWLNQLHQRLKS